MKDQENDLDQGQTFSTFQNYEEQNVWEPEQETGLKLPPPMNRKITRCQVMNL